VLPTSVTGTDWAVLLRLLLPLVNPIVTAPDELLPRAPAAHTDR
jgi:hypothetical protein